MLQALGIVKEEDENAGFGKNRLAEKEATIDDLKGSQVLDTSEIAAGAGRMFNKFITDTRAGMSSIKGAVTPEFVNRLMNTKKYKQQVEQAERLLSFLYLSFPSSFFFLLFFMI